MCSRPEWVSRLLNHTVHPALLLNWPQSIWKRSWQKHIKEQLAYLNISNPGKTPICPCKSTVSSWNTSWSQTHVLCRKTDATVWVCLTNGSTGMSHWECISHSSACLVKESKVLSGFSFCSLLQGGEGVPLTPHSDWTEAGSVRDDRERWCCCGDTAGEDREPLWVDGRLGEGARTSRLAENYPSTSA